jgi:pathogenesis-related protein 1
MGRQAVILARIETAPANPFSPRMVTAITAFRSGTGLFLLEGKPKRSLPVVDKGKPSMIAARVLLIWGVWIALMAAIAGAQSRNWPEGVLAREMLAVHNAVRTEVKLPPLEWSNELAAFSRKWAVMLLAKNRVFHNPDSPYGENLFVTGEGSVTPSVVVRQWASESGDYHYRSNSCSGDCGHYTQIVWRNTRRVGCAVARGAGREVWVCSYDPPGNYQGEWPY